MSNKNIAQNVANISICSLVASVDIPESMKYNSALPVLRNVQNSASNKSKLETKDLETYRTMVFVDNMMTRILSIRFK